MCGLTHNKLIEILDYNPNTGIFTWKERIAKCIQIGSVAGSLDKSGYTYIGISGKTYAAHTLAWLYYYGTWPIYQIDHIFGNRSDNRIQYLRDVSQLLNTQNTTKPTTRNSTGFLGVSFFKRHPKPYHAQIQVKGKTMHLGFYNTPEEASQAYWEAKIKFHSLPIMVGGVSFVATLGS